MGNDSSVPLKVQKAQKSKDGPQLIEDCEQKPIYQKKALRSQSKPRPRKSSKEDCSVPTTPSSVASDGMTVPGPPSSTTDRRRSKSLCAAQMEKDAQAAAATARSESEREPKDSKTKSSSGLVPPLNRVRIQQCFKTAKPNMGEAILKRASGARPELRAVFGRLKEDEWENMAHTMQSLLSEAVAHLDAADEVLLKAKGYGESYASLCPLGFRPDLFSALADAAIAECVKLDAGLHKRCETLQAWSQLIGALFSSVRDGYYQRVRFQRRSSLPQHVVAKQLSIDASRLQPTLVE